MVGWGEFLVWDCGGSLEGVEEETCEARVDVSIFFWDAEVFCAGWAS